MKDFLLRVLLLLYFTYEYTYAWEDDEFTISTPKHPHFPYSEGLHIIVSPKHEVPNAWEDIELSEATFKLTSKVCKIMAELEIAPWFNIQANGNWGLLPGNTPFSHVHIYGSLYISLHPVGMI